MNKPRKYLLFDRGIIDGHLCQNAVLRLAKAEKDTKNNPMMTEEFFANPSKPWEVRYDNGYPNVFRDIEQNVFRLYYTTFSYDKDSAQTRLEERPFRQYMPSKSRATCTCYAMSTDGIHWQKPELGLSEFEGNLANNIILKNAHGTSVLYDRADPDPAKRYKLITKMHYSQENNYMAVAFSRDGIDFSTPQPWPKYNPPADTHNFAFVDPKTNRYVLVTRIWKDGIRIAAKSESSDFLTWTEPEEIARGIGFDSQVYSMPVFFYEGLYLGLASIYHDGDRSAENFDTVDLSLMYTYDLRHFDWIEAGAALIERGKGKYPDGDWDCGCIYASSPIEIDDRICIYYMGGNGQHTNFRETSLGRAWIDKDKFAYYAAKESSKEATLTLRPANFYGEHLEILADIEDDGWIDCEFIDVSNSSYFDEVASARGRKQVTRITKSGWNKIIFGNMSTSYLAEKPLSLCLKFRNSRIYAIEGDLAITRQERLERG
ncbi:MAG TPA: hypothetical protein P5213_00970 [Rectinema sp.]|nr:hypothetical protein [Rectinema sp.]